MREEKKMRETLYRFEIFVKWLSTNPMAADEKARALEMFDFDHFTISDFALTVTETGLYPSDKIVERMNELADKIKGDLNKKELELDVVEEDLENTKKQLEEMKEALAVKDQKINKLIEEKKTLKEALNRKRRIEPLPHNSKKNVKFV